MSVIQNDGLTFIKDRDKVPHLIRKRNCDKMTGTELRKTAKNKKKPQVLIYHRCDAITEKVTTVAVGIKKERREKVDRSNISILMYPF